MSNQSQFRDVYDFCGKPPCPGGPSGPVVFDASGALYGTAYAGGGRGGSCGSFGCGAIYKLTPSGSGYVESNPYSFCEKAECSDGSYPSGALALDAQGSIYGTTTSGGKKNEGVVFELTPFASGYKERVLYSFCPGSVRSKDNICMDGQAPDAGVILGKHGAVYGTTSGGSSNCQYSTQNLSGCGIVFKLTRSGKKYTESVIYTFCEKTGCLDGAGPKAALTIDKAGTLYGVTSSGGEYGYGTVFSLTPSKGSYAEHVLYSFCQAAYCADGATPNSRLILGQGGALFGTTNSGGRTGCYLASIGCGTVFSLTPSGTAYKERVLHAFCRDVPTCARGAFPIGVVFGKNGVIYGATFAGGRYDDDGFYCGLIFKLAPTRPQHYEYRVLYDVGATGNSCWPNSTPVLRDDGALFGTSNGYINIFYGQTGTVWELQLEH